VAQYYTLPTPIYYPYNLYNSSLLTTTFNSQGYYNVPISVTTQNVWDNWTGSTFSNNNNPFQTYQTITPVVWETWNEQVNVSAEQREANRRAAAERTAERERIYAKSVEDREAAHAKALHLFLSVLRPEELETYKKEECIYVRGSRGRRYRIRCNRSQSGNVDWLDEKGNKLASLCCHPRELVPNPDAWMVQKLTLEHDEDHFTQLANYSPMPGVRIPAFR